MRLLSVGSLILALVVTAGSVSPIPPDYCDFQCAPAQLPACGTNGKYFHRFPGICELDKYNCLHPHRGFQKVGDRKCVATARVGCKKGDY